MLISSTVVMLGNLILFYSENIWITYLAMVVFGIGFGFGMFAPVKNACFYKPEKKGIISALVTALGHVAGAAFNIIGEKMINSSGYTLSEDEVRYPYYIARNVKSYYKFIFYTVPVGTFLGILFTFQYSHNKQEKKDPMLVTPEEMPRESIGSFTPKDPNNLTAEEKEMYKKDIMKIVKNKRVWTLAMVNWLGTFLLFLVLNTFKTIGATAPKRVDANMLMYTAVFVALSLSLASPFWGFLIDKFSFKVLFSIVNIVGIIIGVAIVLGLYYLPLLFCVVVAIDGLCVSGFMSILNPHIMKIFGIHYSMIVSGIIGLVAGTSNFIGSIFSFVVASVFKNNQNFAYGCIFVFGSVLNVVSLILTFFESNEPFEFTKKDIENVDGITFDASSRESRITVVTEEGIAKPEA